jgi:hypothetical protein
VGGGVLFPTRPQLEVPVSNMPYHKYLSKINYTYLTTSCLLPFAFCLSSLGNLFCTTT